MVLDLNSMDYNKFRNIHPIQYIYVPKPPTTSYEQGSGVLNTDFSLCKCIHYLAVTNRDLFFLFYRDQ